MTKKPCEWEGHEAALDEAGWCPVCDEGEVDGEWAERNGLDLTTDDGMLLAEMYGSKEQDK